MEATLDLEPARDTLIRWFGERIGAPVSLSPFDVPAHGGFSHDTLMCSMSWGHSVRSIVVRVEPGDHAIFPTYDLEAQYRVIEALRVSSGVPVPEVLWWEPDPSVLGRRFFVMAHVDGRIPPDNPPFVMEGWLHDASLDEQRRAQAAVVETLAAVHRVDPRTLALGAALGELGIDGEIARWRAYLDWAGKGASLPILETVFDWCVANRPTDEPHGALCWGDARFGNVVFGDDFSVLAILDWEMAVLAPPELDLGWFLFIHDTTLMWLPDLPGFAPRHVVIADYERTLGRVARDLRWYEVWAGMKAAAIQAQIVRRSHERGLVPDLLGREETNPVVASLRRLIEV